MLLGGDSILRAARAWPRLVRVDHREWAQSGIADDYHLDCLEPRSGTLLPSPRHV